jgi:hypothetical protein
MSQIKFNTEINNEQCTVVGGWDDPLQCYHLTVFDDKDEDEPLWDAWGKLSFSSCSDFQNILDAFNNDFPGVAAPTEFWEKCEEKLGNVFYSCN